jgi:hypothetical protein
MQEQDAITAIPVDDVPIERRERRAYNLRKDLSMAVGQKTHRSCRLWR